MQQIIETLSDPADHLALDEAALLLADAGEMPETIRVWQFDRPVVVVGRSTRVQFEVNRELCAVKGIPIMRRCSGGASVVGGPGCLMYSVVISLETRPHLRKIDAAHDYVIRRVLAAVKQQVDAAKLQGICDLTLNERKFSGNSLRISRCSFLYHGTILYDVDLSLLADCLEGAPRQPDYRKGRDHNDFVTNVALDPDRFAIKLMQQFAVAGDPITQLPQTKMLALRQTRYDLPEWHSRH